MKRFVTVTSNVFGVMMIAFAVLVTIDTIVRKLLNFSFQGTDELGGYALAVGSSLAFTVALIERAHIRIDLLHERLPARVQAVLNWLSSLMLAGFGVMLVWVCYGVITDTMAYRSTAATPWATPMIYPQSVWYVALIGFAVAGVLLALRATLLLVRGDIVQLNADYHPKGTMEELEEELKDLGSR
jgi:TRAP-type C4-dicarboxylate transport system permease small subunit